MPSKSIEGRLDEVFKAVLTLKNMDECYRFFEDICTISELLAMSQRFEVAKMLKSGSVYSEIVKKTGASTATISRVNRSLQYGAEGYAVAFERLKAQEEDGAKTE